MVEGIPVPSSHSVIDASTHRQRICAHEYKSLAWVEIRFKFYLA